MKTCQKVHRVWHSIIKFIPLLVKNSGIMSLSEGDLESINKECNIEPLSSKVDFLRLELVEQPSSCICQGDVLEEPTVVGQVEIEHLNVHELREMDQFKQPQSDQILPNCSGNITTYISKIEKKPS